MVAQALPELRITRSGPSGGPSASLHKEDMPYETRSILLPLSFDRRLRPAVSSSDQLGHDGSPGYPPYISRRTGDGAYRITVAVAGFSEPELNIEVKENTLTIHGEKQVKAENEAEPLYQGIAARAFERVFQLADYVQVKGASLENGLLHVDLVREIPEAKKPRQIPIGQANGNGKPVVVEAKVAA